MIAFWVPEEGRFGIDAFLALRGKAVAHLFDVRTYEAIGPAFDLDSRVHVFAALDRLTGSQRTVAATLHDQIAARLPAPSLLNDPRRATLRFPLLRALWSEGVNAYAVFHPWELRRVSRFPVFVRRASDHSGSRSRLLRTPAELRRALASLVVRGHPWRDLMIVEFCDTADPSGTYRKYAAFMVGDTIVPSQVMAGHDWRLKSSATEATAELQRENLAYIEANPHESWIRSVFALARIDYGRIDYGLLPNGAPQVWEINLNPTVGRAPGYVRSGDPVSTEVESLRQQARALYHERLRDAFAAIDLPAAATPVRVEVRAPLLRQAAREVARRRRRDAVVSILRRRRKNSHRGAREAGAREAPESERQSCTP